MLTKRSSLIILTLRIRAFCLPIAAIPFRCFNEIIEGYIDMLALFVPKGRKPRSWVSMAQLFFSELLSYGKLDVVDVNVKNKDERVKIKLLLR